MNSRLEKLRQRAIRKNKKAGRLLKKIDRELSKRKTNLSKVMAFQKKSTKLLNQALKYVNKRENLKRSGNLETPKTVNFNVEKVSERFVKKFGATSCVYRATMARSEEDNSLSLKDIFEELDNLFTETIDQV
jgi:hypothetical protein